MKEKISNALINTFWVIVGGLVVLYAGWLLWNGFANAQPGTGGEYDVPTEICSQAGAGTC